MPNNTKIYIEQRNFYKPDKIKFVFIFESPPVNGGYFYDDNGSEKEILFRNMMLTLFNTNFPNKKIGLTMFKKYGFILVDLSYIPVNGEKNQKKRKDILESQFLTLKKDLKLLVSDNTKIVLVMRHVTDICLKNNLNNVINRNTFIPFPNHYHFYKFKGNIRKLVFGDEEKYIQTKE